MGRSRFRWAGSDRLAQHLAVSSFRNGSSWRLDARGYSYDRPHRRVTNVVRRTPLGRAKAWAGVAIRERHALLSQALPELPQKREFTSFGPRPERMLASRETSRLAWASM